MRSTIHPLYAFSLPRSSLNLNMPPNPLREALTLPAQEVSLASCCNNEREMGEDEVSAKAIHDGVSSKRRSAWESGQSIAAVSRSLGLVEQTLFDEGTSRGEADRHRRQIEIE